MPMRSSPCSGKGAREEKEATEIASYDRLSGLESRSRLGEGSGQRVIDHCLRCRRTFVVCVLVRRRPGGVRVFRARWPRNEHHARSRIRRNRAANMPDRIRPDDFLGCGLTTPQVRAFDLHAITGAQVMIAKPRRRSVRHDAVGSLAEAPDAYAEAEPRHAGHGEGEVSRRVRDGASETELYRHESGDERLRKNRAARSPTCLATSRRWSIIDDRPRPGANSVEVPFQQYYATEFGLCRARVFSFFAWTTFRRRGAVNVDPAIYVSAAATGHPSYDDKFLSEG
jgi:hypothetical protein